jgi:hypothetical protein
MSDGLDCRRTKTSRLFVPNKGKFHSAATEQVPGFKSVTETESTPRNPDLSGRTVIARTSELGFLPVYNGKKVIGVLRYDEERVPRTEPLEAELFGA